MIARLTPDQKAACSNHVGVNSHFLPLFWQPFALAKTILCFPVPHNAICLPPKFCINYCCEMLLGVLHISVFHNNSLCKTWGQTVCIMGNWKIVNTGRSKCKHVVKRNRNSSYVESCCLSVCSLSLEVATRWTKLNRLAIKISLRVSVS